MNSTFKVYLSPTVSAFVMACGTIRIYSGLMDMMTDGELVYVIGHEMGHVVENHIKEKLRLAYAGSAVRKAIASQSNEVGGIARSAVGALTENLLNSQFSQHEEREADDFGGMFLKQKGHDIQPGNFRLDETGDPGRQSLVFVKSSGTCETRQTLAKQCLDTGKG